MSGALDIGGVLSIRCTTCGEERGNECRTSPTSPGGFRVTRPHAARLAAAPPIVEAHVGDLVLVRYRGEHVAQLADIGVVLAVRFWRPSAQVFASPRLLEREAVIGLAPDDARTAMARTELEHEALLADEGRLVDVTLDPPALPADIAEGRGPFDPGQSTSDPSLIGPFEIVSPWFTLNGAPTKAPPKGW